MKIGIVNYSIGNVGSVLSALDFYRYDVKLVSSPEQLRSVDIIVLSGVGNVPTAVSRLKYLKFWDRLNKEVLINKKPVIGICLGMQLFADIGYEGGKTKCLGWIKGEVVKLNGESVRIPHMGWNRVDALKGNFFNNINYNYFYFMHSYRFVPLDKSVIVAVTRYGNEEIVAMVRKDNIVGVQFHPEKSQGDGLRLLRTIVEYFR